MNFTIRGIKFLRLFLISILIPATIFAAPFPGDMSVVEQAISESWKPDASGNLEKRARIWNHHFGDWSDRRILEAFMACANEKPGNQASVLAFGSPLFVLSQEMIKDSSFLREVLATEDDVRRFFIASNFAGYFTIKKKEDFIAEKSRMLFNHGRVAENSGNYDPPVYDVSAYAYDSIVSNLKTLNSSFNEEEIIRSKGNIPIEEKIPILARWLKDNWPGCENIELKTQFNRENHAAKPVIEREPRPDRKSDRTKPEIEVGGRKSVSPSIIAAGLLLLGCLALLFKVWKNRST